ncbi:MAG: hypothetical protein ABIH27_06300 [Candidatus Omnitrophota bacterium]
MKKAIKPVVIINIIVFFAAVSLLVYFTRLIVNADYFTIKDIICREANPADFYYLAGKNIFSLNLKKESARLSAFYPHYKLVRLVRIIPNQIYIDLLRRVPIAYLKLYRNFYVDEALFIFEFPDTKVVGDLPVIYGLDKATFAIKPGKRYNIPELEAAIEIIKEIRANKALDNFKIKRIDLKSHADAVILGSLRVSGNVQIFSILEIRIPQANIKSKIRILSSLFSQGIDNLRKIKYIDLRFKEPVVKFKNAA